MKWGDDAIISLRVSVARRTGATDRRSLNKERRRMNLSCVKEKKVVWCFLETEQRRTVMRELGEVEGSLLEARVWLT